MSLWSFVICLHGDRLSDSGIPARLARQLFCCESCPSCWLVIIFWWFKSILVAPSARSAVRRCTRCHAQVLANLFLMIMCYHYFKDQISCSASEVNKWSKAGRREKKLIKDQSHRFVKANRVLHPYHRRSLWSLNKSSKMPSVYRCLQCCILNLWSRVQDFWKIIMETSQIENRFIRKRNH